MQPPAAGRRRQRQDRGRGAGGLAGDRKRLSGGAHGAHRNPRRAALPQARRLAGTARRALSPGCRGSQPRPSSTAALAGDRGRAKPSSRSAPMRCSRKPVSFAQPGAGHRRRAAPLRRRPAAGADGRRAAEPHQLMMSATPIPRTLSMSYFADLDVSVIDELPPGRTPIVTKLVERRAPRRGDGARARRLPRRRPGLLGVPADRGIRERCSCKTAHGHLRDPDGHLPGTATSAWCTAA